MLNKIQFNSIQFNCIPTFVKFPWKLAGHVRSNSSKCLVPNTVALSVFIVLCVNFTHEMCKCIHFGLPNKLETISLDIAALNKLVGYPKSRV